MGQSHLCFSKSVSQVGLKCVLSLGWGTHQSSNGKPTSRLYNFQSSLCPASGPSKHVHAPHKQSPGFPGLPALLLVPLALQASRRTHLPCVNPRGEVPSMWLTLLLREELHLCILPFPLSLLPEAQVSTSSLPFPFYPILFEFSLLPWLYSGKTVFVEREERKEFLGR